MRVLIDGDNCPVTDAAIRLAGEYDLECYVFVNEVRRHTAYPGARKFVVPVRYDAVDRAILDAVENGDIVVTDDVRLAVSSHESGATPIKANGGGYYFGEKMPPFVYSAPIAPTIIVEDAQVKFRKSREKLFSFRANNLIAALTGTTASAEYWEISAEERRLRLELRETTAAHLAERRTVRAMYRISLQCAYSSRKISKMKNYVKEKRRYETQSREYERRIEARRGVQDRAHKREYAAKVEKNYALDSGERREMRESVYEYAAHKHEDRLNILLEQQWKVERRTEKLLREKEIVRLAGALRAAAEIRRLAEEAESVKLVEYTYRKANGKHTKRAEKVAQKRAREDAERTVMLEQLREYISDFDKTRRNISQNNNGTVHNPPKDTVSIVEIFCVKERKRLEKRHSHKQRLIY